MDEMFPALMGQAGASIDEVQKVNMQPAATLSALFTGRVDSFATSVIVKATLEDKGLAAHAMLYSDPGVDLPGPYLVASDQTRKEHPELVHKMVAAAQNHCATIEDPEAAAESFADESNNCTDDKALNELKLALPLMESDSVSESCFSVTHDVETTVKVLKKYGLVDKAKRADT